MTQTLAGMHDVPRLGGPPVAIGALTARDIMICPVATTTPGTELEAVRRQLLELAIGGVPVVDAAGRPLGMLSKTDLLRDAQRPHVELLVEERDATTRLGYEARAASAQTVADLMTPNAISVSEAATIGEVARRMSHKCVHRVVVVDDTGRVSGIVTSFDLLRLLGQRLT